MRVNLGCVGVVLLAGCATESTRGKDRSAVLPALRVRYLARPTEVISKPKFAIGAEVSGTIARGEFTRPEGMVRYGADVAQAHAVVGVVSQRLELLGLFGLGYSDLEVDVPSAPQGRAGAGVSGGAELAWRTWSWLGPYARYTGLFGAGGEWRRLEVGIDVRPTNGWSIQAAFAEQVMEDDDLFFGDDFRVETRGVHLGVMLRF